MSIPELDVSRETLGLLQAYADLLERWTKSINLVSKSSRDEIWTRHVLDSAQLTRLTEPPMHWADLGSGGGLPGMVVAILLRDAPTRVSLVESDQRKATFLRTANRELGLSVNVHAARIENAPALNADMISARALASLPDLLALSERHLAHGGRCLFMKGRTAAKEVAAAQQNWSFSRSEHPSLTDPDATILEIGDLARA